jgi:ubiquinol-cytochrome c reductase iron-sulfur subunit
MSKPEVDQGRRTWVAIACGAGAVGGVATAVPFVTSLQPSERARAAGAPVEVDISDLQPGQKKTVEWRGKPVWILRRTPEMLDAVKKADPMVADPKSERHPDEFTPMADTRNEYRSIKPEVFVAVGVCTHLGCSPVDRFQPGAQPSLPEDWPGGFLCPCHGSTYDLAGRVFKNKPAPDNLEVPPYTFLSDTKLLIGEAKKA